MEILKRKRKNLLLISFENLEREEIILTLKEIRENMRKIFRKHIGKGEAISPTQLFFEIFNTDPDEVDIYRREFWWNVIKKVISQMRYDGDIFIVNTGKRLFVLQSSDELKNFTDRIDNNIRGMENTKKMARDWIRERKWMNI